MLEFDRGILEALQNAGVTYLITQKHSPELKVDEDVGEFILHPFVNLQNAELFLKGNMKGKYEDQQDFVLYPITDEEVFEMADGVFGCVFWLKEKR